MLTAVGLTSCLKVVVSCPETSSLLSAVSLAQLRSRAHEAQVTPLLFPVPSCELCIGDCVLTHTPDHS